MAEDALVQTGIAGLDDLLHGGISRNNVILVVGGSELERLHSASSLSIKHHRT